MTTDEIRVFQVDDWAYVAALSAEEAAAHIEAETGRPDNPLFQELDEVQPTGTLAVLLQEHITSGQGIPALIAVDAHYA